MSWHTKWSKSAKSLGLMITTCGIATNLTLASCSTQDSILFSHSGAGGDEIGVLLDGEYGRRQRPWLNLWPSGFNDRLYFFKRSEVPSNAAGAAMLRVGYLTGPGEIIAFTWGERPTLLENVNWTQSGAQVPFDFKPPYILPIHIWLIAGDGTQQEQEELADAKLNWAYINWSMEHTGLTYMTTTRTITYIPTPNSEVINDCDDIDELASTFHDPNGINVYIVSSVFSEFNHRITLTTNGYSAKFCPNIRDDVIVLGKNASWHLWVHEFGHAFTLGHIDHLTFPTRPQPLFDDLNVMYSSSNFRAYFTEGQTFRQAFHPESAINSVLNMNGPGFTGRDCPNFIGDTNETMWPNYNLRSQCPLLQLRFWADGNFPSDVPQNQTAWLGIWWWWWAIFN